MTSSIPTSPRADPTIFTACRDGMISEATTSDHWSFHVRRIARPSQRESEEPALQRGNSEARRGYSFQWEREDKRRRVLRQRRLDPCHGRPWRRSTRESAHDQDERNRRALFQGHSVAIRSLRLL